LERGGGITEAEWHPGEPERPSVARERSLIHIVAVDPYLVKT